MDENMKIIIEKRIEKTAENLRKNNMETYVAENSKQAATIAIMFCILLILIKSRLTQNRL